jgi:hypothetical protein
MSLNYENTDYDDITNSTIEDLEDQYGFKFNLMPPHQVYEMEVQTVNGQDMNVPVRDDNGNTIKITDYDTNIDNRGSLNLIIESIVGNVMKWVSTSAVDSIEYAELYGSEVSATGTITIDSINIPVLVDVFNTNGNSSGLVPDHTNSRIEVNNDGVYQMWVNVSYRMDSDNSDEIKFQVRKIDSFNSYMYFDNLKSYQTMDDSQGYSNLSMNGVISCHSGDKLYLYVSNMSDGRDIVIENVSMIVKKIS